MYVEFEPSGHLPPAETAVLFDMEAGSKKRKKSPTGRDKARRWNIIHGRKIIGQPEHPEQRINHGVVKRSQRRAMRLPPPH